MAFQVRLDVLLTDIQMAFSVGVFCLFLQPLLQAREADVRTLLEPQLGWSKRLRVNFDREFAWLTGRVHHVKTINSRTGCAIEPTILDVHRSILLFLAQARPAKFRSP